MTVDQQVVVGDALRLPLADASVQCVVTSPPYWGLRDYGTPGQLGLEPTPEAYVENMVAVFREVWRVLRKDGVMFVNMGDCYNAARDGGHPGGRKQWKPEQAKYQNRSGGNAPGLKPKDLVGIPWRLAFALQADGWYLRSDIIWAKPNPMPESCTDRPTKAHEYVFLLTKRARYFYDAEAVRETSESGPSDITKMLESKERIGGKHKNLDDRLNKASATTNIGQKRAVGEPSGRNLRSVWTIPEHEWAQFLHWRAQQVQQQPDVWTIPTQPFPEAHFATFPEKLVEPCVKAGTAQNGCCPKCAAPWVRVVEKNRRLTRPGKTTKIKIPGGWDVDAAAHGTIHHEGRTEAQYREVSEVGNRDPGRHVTETRTVEWRPGCKCDAGEPVPCVVLDPFAGSGTVGVVCHKLGRRFVGVELKPEYAQMARRRIGRTQRPATFRDDEKAEDAPLFAMVADDV